MHEEDDIERSAAFDEQLRDQVAVNSDANETSRMQTIRLLHEVFRAPTLSVDETLESEPSLPDRIGRFRIRRQLGRGGFGTVYLADDPLLNRQVAVKVIHSHLLLDPAVRNRALREREAMARLQHPNIIPVWEASEDQSQVFIVSEYCAGQSLAQWLDEHPGALSATTAARWVYKLADAVSHSHQRGVIHRDLKPGNILLDPITKVHTACSTMDDGLEPRLSDFGLAKILDSSGACTSNMATQSGLFVGSIEYASPEQVKGHPEQIGPATDVYALGVVLYQLLTGHLPHEADSQYELARKICEEDARFTSEFQSKIPKDLQAIALRAMAIQASQRYASADAFRDDLNRFLREEPVKARPVTTLEQLLRVTRKRPAVTAMAVGCCLLSLLYLYNLAASNHRLSEQSQALEIALAHAREQTRRAEEGQKQLNKLRYRETIKLALDQWQQQNYIGLHDTLQRLSHHEPSTLELTYLRRQLESNYHKFDLQDDPVHALVWYPQEARILTVGASGKLRRWLPGQATAVSEVATAIGGRALAIHPLGHTFSIPENVMASLDPDNPSPLIRDSSASHITFWNARTGQRCQEPVQFHSRTVESLEYSPDGRWLAAGPRYGNVVVSDLQSGEPFAIKATRRNRQVLFSPASDRIAVYTEVGVIEIHNLRTRKLVTTCQHRSGSELGSCYSMAWIPGQEALIVNAAPESLNIYSTEDGRSLGSFRAGIEGETIAVSPDGKYVAIGDGLGFVKVFDLQAMQASPSQPVEVTPRQRVLYGKVLDMTFIDTARLVAADEEGNMIQLTLPNRPPSLKIKGWMGDIHWHDNQHLWAFPVDGTALRFVEAHENGLQLTTELPAHADHEVTRVQNAQHIARVTLGGLVTIVDAQSGALISSCQLPAGNAPLSHARVCERMLLSADGKLLYATGFNNRLCAIRVNDGTIAWSLALTNTGLALAEDAEQGHLYLGGGFEYLNIIDLTNGKVIDTQVAGNGVRALLADHKKGILFSGHKDGTVRRRHLAPYKSTDAPSIISRMSNTSITEVTATPDRRTMIVGAEDGVVRLADEELSQYGILYRSELRDAEITSMKWSPDERKLAALISSAKDSESEIVMFDTADSSAKP